MDNNNLIKFTDIDGSEKVAEVVLAVEAGNPLKKYIIYTMNEITNDMVTMYLATMSEEGDRVVLRSVDDEEEWKMIKNLMRDIVKQNKEV